MCVLPLDLPTAGLVKCWIWLYLDKRPTRGVKSASGQSSNTNCDNSLVSFSSMTRFDRDCVVEAESASSIVEVSEE